MTRRFGVPVAALALLLGASAAAAEPSAQPASTLTVASRADPHAGKPFVGYVFVVPTAARRGLVAVDANCPGTVLGRDVPGRVSRVPAHAIPTVLICTWAIPRDRVGWTFRARMEIETQRKLRDGSIELDSDEGRVTAWIIQP